MKKAIFWLIILAFIAYAGFQFGTPYYRYFALKDHAKAITKIPLETEEMIRAKVFERSKELNVPLAKKDVIVTRTDGLVRIKISWSEVVDILGFYQKTLHFKIDTKE